MVEASDARPSLAVIVPVWHDTAALAALLGAPRQAEDQWIVVNGDATDRSLDAVRQAHGDVCWLESEPGRGQQLAVGVARATADWIVLLHADTRLADGWRDEVTGVAAGALKEWGCFRLRLDTPAWQARLIEVGVRLRVWLFRLPYGDQAMFFRRVTLEALGGVPPVPLMEDVALARRFARIGAPVQVDVAGRDIGSAVGARRLVPSQRPKRVGVDAVPAGRAAGAAGRGV